MIDPKKLQCFTTASWLRGYVDSLDEYKHGPLIYKLHQAADLLESVWDEYAAESARTVDSGYGLSRCPQKMLL